ncbi:MAG: hypothetical protein SVU32_08405 [Candidatus Nanohaloarchaea archaeon]|nr:hypothetical protein [Candidatus Nanohaloarchaea archaeon]
MVAPETQLTYDFFNLAGTFLLVLPLLIASYTADRWLDHDFYTTLLQLGTAMIFLTPIVLQYRGTGHVSVVLPLVFVFLTLPSAVSIGIASDVRYGSIGWFLALLFFQLIGQFTVFRPEYFTQGTTGLLGLQGFTGYIMYMAFVGMVGGLFGMTVRNFSQ